MAELRAAILDWEVKGGREGARAANDSEEPSQESWTTTCKHFYVREREKLQFVYSVWISRYT